MRLMLFLIVLSVLFLPSCHSSRKAKAELVWVKKSNSKQDEMVAYAQKYLGTPYKYAGKDPRAFDCSGFTSYVFSAFDLRLSATADGQSRQGREISPDRVRAGDLVFFKRPRNRQIFHVSLVVSNTSEGITVIHSTTSRGVIMENISRSSYWKPFLYKARRFLD